MFLRQSLCSLLSQTILPDEIILVLDGPLTEELNSVVREFQQQVPFFTVIPLAVNQGLGNALNEGLKHCSYDWVARMDTDDIAKPDRFEKQIKVFQEHPEIDVVGAWIDEFEEDVNEIVSTRKVPQNHEDIVRYARRRSPMNHVTVMFKKNKVIEAGSYQSFYLLEDYYLWVRMMNRGIKFYNIQSSLVDVRGGIAMAGRRGGWKYMKSEIRFQDFLLKTRFISLGEYLMNIIIRFIVRILPNSLRAFIYKYALRY